jgi:FKBP-type peptidyl-prolyl cis-trans isomerase
LQFGDEVLLIYDSVPAANGFEKQGMYLESVRFTPFPFYKEDTLLRQKQNRVTYQDVVRTDNPLSVEAQDTISIRFTGYYKTDNGNRRIFDSSMDLQRGFTFVLNATSIIPGLKDGIIGMRSGTEGLPKRGIPPKTNLIFDVEVLHISKHKL